MTLIINDTEENKIFKLKLKKITDENHDKNQIFKNSTFKHVILFNHFLFD